MGRAFEYRKATKLKRWGNMARTFTRIGKQIAIAVKAGGPDPENNTCVLLLLLQNVRICRRITWNALSKMQWVKIRRTIKK